MEQLKNNENALSEDVYFYIFSFDQNQEKKEDVI